jgi:hypothetical protein
VPLAGGYPKRDRRLWLRAFARLAKRQASPQSPTCETHGIDAKNPLRFFWDQLDSQLSDSPPEIRCRQIGTSDLDAIADLLVAGFPRRSRGYWVRALELLSHRVPPEGYPRYGLMLEVGTAAVGVILLICTKMQNSCAVQCCESSWYVAPEFRAYASLLILKTFKFRATHLNLSPAPHTVPIIEALGFRRFCNGVFAAVPALAAETGKTKIIRVVNTMHPEKFLPVGVLRLLQDHESFGCLSLWCETQDGGVPFIFRRRFMKQMVPSAQLIYCPAVDELIRFGGPIGRFLALRGMPFMTVPANGPIPGLLGKYFDDRPIYYLGPDRPRLGDLTYTEMAMFGI